MASPGALRNPAAAWLRLIARVRDASPTGLKQLRAELEALASQYVQDRRIPNQIKDLLFSGLRLTPASKGISSLRYQFSRPLWYLLALTTTILLAVSANLSALYFARARAKADGLVTRRILGASIKQLISETFASAAVPVLIGVGLGIAASGWLLRVLIRMILGDDTNTFVMGSIDYAVAGFVVCITVCVCAIVGLTPRSVGSKTRGRGCVRIAEDPDGRPAEVRTIAPGSADRCVPHSADSYRTICEESAECPEFASGNGYVICHDRPIGGGSHDLFRRQTGSFMTICP